MTTKTCAACDEPRGQGSGRGLCKRCYHGGRRRGQIEGRQRKQRPLAETVALYDSLSDQGLTTVEIAAQLGIKRASLCSALSRAGRGFGQGGPGGAEGDRIVDEVAIARCINGTLNARRLTAAEREEAIQVLHHRGHTPAEIARRVGASLTVICSFIEVPSVEHGPGRLERTAPGDCTSSQAERARRAVAGSATDADDARELLLVLGLIAQHRDAMRPNLDLWTHHVCDLR